MGYAEIIDYNSMVAKRIQDGHVRIEPLKLCDGCAKYQAPWDGMSYQLATGFQDILWLCASCRYNLENKIDDQSSPQL